MLKLILIIWIYYMSYSIFRRFYLLSYSVLLTLLLILLFDSIFLIVSYIGIPCIQYLLSTNQYSNKLVQQVLNKIYAVNRFFGVSPNEPKNSKKFQKNVKFGLQSDINMEKKMNGSDRLFGFWNFKFPPEAFRPIC